MLLSIGMFIYSERGTQGCIAIHRGSENVIDPSKTIKGFKGDIIILAQFEINIIISEGLATLRPNLVTGTRLYFKGWLGIAREAKMIQAHPCDT